MLANGLGEAFNKTSYAFIEKEKILYRKQKRLGCNLLEAV